MNKEQVHKRRIAVWDKYPQNAVKSYSEILKRSDRWDETSIRCFLKDVENDPEYLERCLDNSIRLEFPEFSIEFIGTDRVYLIKKYQDSLSYSREVQGTDIPRFLDLLDDFIRENHSEEIDKYNKYVNNMSKPVRFDGDIVITDPCYVVPEEAWSLDTERDLFNGYGFDDIFSKYIWGPTIYGDWSCTTYQIDDPDPGLVLINGETWDRSRLLGEFAADAGLVGVFYLSEVKLGDLPECCRTIIKDFHGEIQRIVIDSEVHIVGSGNINFLTIQTGA